MENLSKIVKVPNKLKKVFDHSCDEYYRIDVDNGDKPLSLMFTAAELNKAVERNKKWIRLSNS